MTSLCIGRLVSRTNNVIHFARLLKQASVDLVSELFGLLAICYGAQSPDATYVSFKYLCYIYKKSVSSFYFEIDIERILCFVPNSSIERYSRLTRSQTRISFSSCHPPPFRHINGL